MFWRDCANSSVFCEKENECNDSAENLVTYSPGVIPGESGPESSGIDCARARFIVIVPCRECTLEPVPREVMRLVG